MKKVRISFYIIASLVALYLGINAFLTYYPNFYPVVPKTVYRSGQLTEHRYGFYLHRYKIRSVISLRSAEPDMPWYQTEQRVIKKTGVKFYEIPMDALGKNSPETLNLLIKTLQTAPKPVLIHCWHGADRTGFASAVSIILFTDASLTDAQKQISYKYGAIDPTTTGKIEFNYYEQWLAAHHYQHSRAHFLEWIKQLPNDKSYAQDQQ